MSHRELNSTTEILSDEKIIDMYWERNEAAIKATDDKYGKYLYTISYNILNDRLNSEECINDTYLNTWNKIPPHRPNVFQRFLSKITRDISVDKYRKAHAQKRVPSELTVSLSELDECIDGIVVNDENEAIGQISKVLNTYLYGLSKRERFIFVCRYYYSDNVKYIAQMLDLSDKTVYRELARIRNGLREALLEEGIVI